MAQPPRAQPASGNGAAAQAQPAFVWPTADEVFAPQRSDAADVAFERVCAFADRLAPGNELSDEDLTDVSEAISARHDIVIERLLNWYRATSGALQAAEARIRALESEISRVRAGAPAPPSSFHAATAPTAPSSDRSTSQPPPGGPAQPPASPVSPVPAPCAPVAAPQRFVHPQHCPAPPAHRRKRGTRGGRRVQARKAAQRVQQQPPVLTQAVLAAVERITSSAVCALSSLLQGSTAAPSRGAVPRAPRSSSAPSPCVPNPSAVPRAASPQAPSPAAHPPAASQRRQRRRRSVNSAASLARSSRSSRNSTRDMDVDSV
jgi:hypothetical protein